MLAVMLFAVAGRAAAQNEDVAGLYTIHMVNAKTLPAATWKRTMSDTSCNTATQNGTLMLDSKGHYAVMIIERDRCMAGTKRWTKPDVSTLFTGTYTAEGGNITFTETGSGQTYQGVLVNGKMTVNVEGEEPFAGQKAAYLFRLQRPTRGKS
jgi:hypothetical protein